MINASKEFKEKLKNGASLVNYADVTLRDGTILHLEPKDFMIGGCRIDDKTTDGKFGAGFVIGKTISLKIANHDERFSGYDFYNATITLYVAMAMDDGSIEKIRKGVYYSTVPETPGDIIEINAVDGMYKLDRDYSASKIAYPATLQSIITGVCLDCGIPMGFREFDNMAFMVQDKPETGTYRQILSYAAQIAGYNARIDNSGYMQLVWYKTAFLDQPVYHGGDFHTYPHDTTLYGGNFTDYGAPTVVSGGLFTDEMPEHVFRFKDLTVHTDDVVITGVRVKNDETEVLFGDPGYVIKVESNPLTEGKENEVANYLGGRMVGLSFRPFSGRVLGNPLYEPFDVCRVSDRKGNTYQSIINSVSYTIGSYTEISCQAEDPIRNESNYISPAAQAVVEARRNTEKKLTEYDKAVQNMNQIAMNAMGFHTTYEEQADGSRITYLHDKPNLADSKTIYKQSIDGFFVSTDGGKSYTAGFDSQGNAVVNVLAAIGIIFDWAKGGTLTLGGSGNVNGAITVLNSSGAQIGRWDKDGIIATSGKFSGSLEAATGSFTGELKAATGSFTGTVNATTLKSANASITGGSIQIQTSNLRESSIRLSYGEYNSSYMSPNGFYVGQEASGYISDLQPGGLVMLYSWTDLLYVNPSEFLYGGMNAIFDSDLTVKGSKNRAVETEGFGTVLQCCYETPSPMFGDVGTGKTDECGYCYIYFDPVFSETVSTDMEYQVFLQKEGPGDIWVEEKTEEYFSVKGTPFLKFSWEAKAKQKGYEYERLEVLDRNKEEIDEDYEYLSMEYLANYERELTKYEEIN